MTGDIINDITRVLSLACMVLLVALALLALVWAGRRLDARGVDPTGPAGRRVLRGAALGAVVGLVGAALGELATEVTRKLFPTDVGIVGFTVTTGVPAAAVVGAVMWWRGRPSSGTARLALASVPVVLVAAWQVLVQWSAQ